MFYCVIYVILGRDFCFGCKYNNKHTKIKILTTDFIIFNHKSIKMYFRLFSEGAERWLGERGYGLYGLKLFKRYAVALICGVYFVPL